MQTLDEDVLETIVSQDGTRIGVWLRGAGPPLVLVHGTSADHGRWAPVAPALAERFTVLAIDRRGRGASGDADDYALEREAEDVAAVVDWTSGAHVLGHSYGGVCALEAALRTTRIAKLVLYEPPLGFVAAPPEIRRRLEELLAAGQRDELVAVFLQGAAGVTDEQLEILRARPAWAGRVAAAHTIPREERAAAEYVFEPSRFASLETPTTFLLGGDSAEPFAAAAHAAEAALPDCRLVVLPGERHVAMDSSPELFLAEVLGFLEES